MDAKQFLAEFGHIANAPCGVQRLREMIYQLAVTGLLSQQTENAESLLQKIELERERLIKKGEYKRILKLENEPLLTPVIDIPQSWAWTRLLDIGEINPKNKLDDEDGKIADFIPMSGISELHQAALVSEIRPWSEIKKGYTHFANNDVAVAKITPCFENGKVAIIRGLKSELGIGAGTTELHVVRLIHEGVLPNYVYIFLRSPYFKVEGEKSMTGTAGQKRLPTEFFATYPFPLPPTEEQSRIVAKVDELMALCDKLEAQQQKKRKLQNQLRQSVLQAVTNAESPKELQDSWKRLAGNFSYLFAEIKDIKNLRQLILQLAIQGKIVKQFPDDEPAKVLLNKISENKAQLARNAKIKRHKSSSPISNDEDSFKLPKGWEYARFGDILINRDAERIPLSVSDRSLRKGKYDYYGASGVIDSVDEYIFDKTLLLIGEDGANLINRSTPIAFLAHGKYWVNNHAHVLDAISVTLLEYVCIHINAISLEPYVTGTAQPKMNQAKMSNIILSIPPLEEQSRIVAKVDELMALCDKLEVQQQKKQKLHSGLATAAIASLTGISTPQQEEPMKAPKTELKAPVRLGTTQPPGNTQAPLASLLARHNGEMGANDLWQRFGGEVDAFYAQLKTEVMHGWIAEPTGAQMLEKEAD